MSAPKEKDFGKGEPQIKNVYQYRPPEEFDHDGIDHSHGGENVKPVKITDENFDSAFKSEPEHKPPKPFYIERGK